MTNASGKLRDPRRHELLPRVLSGFRWQLASQGVAQVLNTVILIVLARLLSPRQFGIAAMAEVVTAFVITYSDCGLGLALVQRESITDTDRSTVFWASTALGAAMAGLCVAAAPLAASFYHTPEVKHLLYVVSLSFFLTGLGSTHRSLQFRAMNFRALEIRSSVAGIVGGAVIVVIAVDGGGAWSVIIGDVAATAVSTLLLLAMGGWTPRLVFSTRSLRELGVFGLRYVGGTTLRTVNGNADNVLVGRVLGQSALGAYSLAYSVILVPISRLASPISQLLAPAFARFQDDKRAIADNWLRGSRLLLIIFLPLMLTIAVTAPDVVHVVFGQKWDKAIPLIRILAPLCTLLSIQGFSDSVLQAVGAVRTYLRLSVLSCALSITAFVIGVHWGLIGMATGFGIATLSFMVIYLVVVARTIETPPSRIISSLSGVLVAAVAMTVAEVAVDALASSRTVPSIVRLLATASAGLIVFALMLLWRERPALLDLVRLAGDGLHLSPRFLPKVPQST